MRITSSFSPFLSLPFHASPSLHPLLPPSFPSYLPPSLPTSLQMDDVVIVDLDNDSVICKLRESSPLPALPSFAVSIFHSRQDTHVHVHT